MAELIRLPHRNSGCLASRDCRKFPFLRLHAELLSTIRRHGDSISKSRRGGTAARSARLRQLCSRYIICPACELYVRRTAPHRRTSWRLATEGGSFRRRAMRNRGSQQAALGGSVSRNDGGRLCCSTARYSIQIRAGRKVAE